MPTTNGMFKYFLFKSNGDALEINSSNIPMDDFLKKYYPEIRIDTLSKDSKVLLFNAAFDTNFDLMYKVIDLLNTKRKRKPYIHEEFEYITLIASDTYAHNYGYLCYGKSDKDFDKREKLLPIIYRSDLYVGESAKSNKCISLDDLKDPRNAIYEIIDYKEKNDKSHNFKEVKELLRSILTIKFKARLPYSDDHFAGRDFGFEEMIAELDGLLHNTIINEEYDSQSSLWINLLSIINYFDKYQRVYDVKNKDVDFIKDYQKLLEIRANRTSYPTIWEYRNDKDKAISRLKKKVDPYQLAYFSIFSEKDIVNGRKKEDKGQVTIADIEAEEMKKINEINLSEDANYTLADYYENQDIYNYFKGIDDDPENRGKSR